MRRRSLTFATPSSSVANVKSQIVRKILGVFVAFGIAGYIGFILLVLAGVAGWFMNIYKLAFCTDLAQLTVMTILRIVGIFAAPLGGLLGWL